MLLGGTLFSLLGGFHLDVAVESWGAEGRKRKKEMWENHSALSEKELVVLEFSSSCWNGPSSVSTRRESLNSVCSEGGLGRGRSSSSSLL